MSTGPAPAWEDPRKVLARHGLRAKQSFSQNFLVSRSVVESIAAAVAPAAGELVVELGPGLGTLTAALLRAGARVVAVERDREMIEVLRAELPGTALEVREADASTIDLSTIDAGRPLAIAGNLPYAITGAIFRHLVEQRALVSRAVLMVQKEVRDRLIAKPGGKTYGALTVFTQAQFAVTHLLHVPAGAFHPAPKVASAVVKLVPHAVPRAAETDAFRTVVRAAFETRRKTLRNGLVRELDPVRADRLLAETGIDGRRRGETLSVEELASLARNLG